MHENSSTNTCMSTDAGTGWDTAQAASDHKWTQTTYQIPLMKVAQEWIDGDVAESSEVIIQSTSTGVHQSLHMVTKEGQGPHCETCDTGTGH